jgi:hypothetical protein
MQREGRGREGASEREVLGSGLGRGTCLLALRVLDRMDDLAAFERRAPGPRRADIRLPLFPLPGNAQLLDRAAGAIARQPPVARAACLLCSRALPLLRLLPAPNAVCAAGACRFTRLCEAEKAMGTTLHQLFGLRRSSSPRPCRLRRPARCAHRANSSQHLRPPLRRRHLRSHPARPHRCPPRRSPQPVLLRPVAAADAAAVRRSPPTMTSAWRRRSCVPRGWFVQRPPLGCTIPDPEPWVRTKVRLLGVPINQQFLNPQWWAGVLACGQLGAAGVRRVVFPPRVYRVSSVFRPPE